ncbi:MAG: citrate synthase [Sedimentisphaerales bacterium]|nr:citrate synthase [Sedimentisphaerales bacterium]
MAENVILEIDDKKYNLPLIIGTEGEKGINILKLRDQTGCIAYDPGFGNTASCDSKITYINGENGIMRYHGIPIEQLAEGSDFIEVAYLLIWGKIPTAQERRHFSDLLTDNALIHENLKSHFEGFPSSAHPMAMLSAMINALGCYHHDLGKIEGEDELGPEQQLEVLAARLISKIRTIAAFSYKMSRGEPFIYPDPNLRYVSNFLHMMFSLPHKHYEAMPEVAKALDMILMLHADHEQNCSTTTVRMVASAGANLFSSVSAGVCALWGRLHGGANMAVINMLQQIHDGGLNAKKCIELAKDPKSDFRLMGFGHRVYKNHDPRARILKGACERLFTKLDHKDPLLDIALELEDLALNDSYFIERKLYPNVDFYSGMILRSIGIPTNMFTVMFAIGRLPGWIAHWREVHEAENMKIARPRQIYTGNKELHYVPMAQRQGVSPIESK